MEIKAQDQIRTFLKRIASVFRKKELDAALDEELRTHIELATAENRARGMNRKQARREAMRSFGGVTQTREAYRSRRGLPFFAILFHDLRYALRQLRKSPGFALTVILTLALGIGSVTAVFSVVKTILLDPYTFRDPGQVVVWRETVREMQQLGSELPDNYRHYLNLKNRAKTIQDAAILGTAGFSVSTGGGHPSIAEGLQISPNFFSVLGVSPFLGRDFRPEEAQAGRDNEIVITWGAWQRLFDGNPSAVGGTLRVDGTLKTVIGVLPQSFRFPVMSILPGHATHGSTERYEIFAPLVPTPEILSINEGELDYLVVARLKAGVSIMRAQSELDGIAKATAAADRLSIHVGVVVEPFGQEITGNIQKPLWLLFAAVFSVLLMACVNLANLQMARAASRDREIAVRAALGAGKGRLLQAVLLENLLLGLAGGVAGIALAIVAQKVLLVVAATLPRLNEVRLSIPMLAFGLTLSILASLAFGIFPALRSWSVPPLTALQTAAARISASRKSTRSRKMLVAVQVACSITLLIVTALITRSFSHLLNRDHRFNSHHIALAEAVLGSTRYDSGNDPAESHGTDPGSLARAEMIDRTLQHLRETPGFESAAVISDLPLTGDSHVDAIARPDHIYPPGEEPLSNRRFISPGYFETMQIPLIAGRDFAAQDKAVWSARAGNACPVILSEKTAELAFPNEAALGRTILQWGRPCTVIGIAADARINNLKRNVPIFYLPYWAYPPTTPVFLLRSSQSFASLGPAMRQAIWSADPEVAIPTLISLDAQIGESVAVERFQAILLSSFASAALLIAVLGIYGVLAYSVSLRTQEFGIRIALGSSRLSLTRLVLFDAATPVFAGIGFGLLGAAAASKWIHSLLYETSPADPTAIALSLALLLAAALAAALIPLRNATTVDPIQALRNE